MILLRMWVMSSKTLIRLSFKIFIGNGAVMSLLYVPRALHEHAYNLNGFESDKRVIPQVIKVCHKAQGRSIKPGKLMTRCHAMLTCSLLLCTAVLAFPSPPSLPLVTWCG